MWWDPRLKLGAGLLSPAGADSWYVGGYSQPWAGRSGVAPLTFGATAVHSPTNEGFEAQFEYRHASGWGVGGGLLRQDVGPDADFVKATYRAVSASKLTVIAEIQAQSMSGRWSPGAYAGLATPEWMLIGGHDGEQWRATVGFLERTERKWRPAAEVLYVDQTPGVVPGAKTWFGNATLGYRGGFLSHAARLGRAMGPQGVEYANPLGFLSGSWNRRLETWEIGRIASARAIDITAPNGARTRYYEVLVFPLQWWGAPPLLEALFCGVTYDEVPRRTRDRGIEVGIATQTVPFSISATVVQSLDGGHLRATVALIRRY